MSMKDLKKKKKILEDNLKFQDDMIKNNKHYDNEEQNVSYGPNHYRQAIEHDKEDLNRVNGEIENQKRIDALKERATLVRGKAGAVEDKKKKKK